MIDSMIRFGGCATNLDRPGGHSPDLGSQGLKGSLTLMSLDLQIPPAGKERYDRKDNSRISFKEHKRSKFKNAAMESSVRGPYRQGRSRAAQPSTRNPKHISLHIEILSFFCHFFYHPTDLTVEDFSRPHLINHAK